MGTAVLDLERSRIWLWSNWLLVFEKDMHETYLGIRFNPNVQVVDGVAQVEIELPDNLTDFAVRAVAILPATLRCAR